MRGFILLKHRFVASKARNLPFFSLTLLFVAGHVVFAGFVTEKLRHHSDSESHENVVASERKIETGQ